METHSLQSKKYPQIGFQVRVKEAVSLTDLATRVGSVLKLNFVPSYHNFFPGDPVVEAFALGLHIFLLADPEVSEQEVGTHILMGTIHAEPESHWPDDYSVFNISEYILGLLHLFDSPQWYIPALEELINE